MRSAFAAGLCGLVLVWCAVAHAQHVAPQVKSAEFRGDVLTIEFNQPMTTWSGAVGFAAATIEPELACKWSWSDELRLACQLPEGDEASRPRPATQYHVALKGGLWSQAGVELTEQHVTAETQAPKIFNYSVATWQSGWPRIELWTTAPVERESLHGALVVTLDGSPLAFNIEPLKGTMQGRELTHWLVLPADTTRGGQLVVTEQPGLRTPLGDLAGTEHAELLRALVGEPFRLRRMTCANALARRPDARQQAQPPEAAAQDDLIHTTCDAGGEVDFEFSDAMTPAAIADFRAALPAGIAFVNTNITAGWQQGADRVMHNPGQVIRLTLEQPQQTFTWTLPATLRSPTGALLQQPPRVVLKSGDFLPSFSAQPAQLVARAGGDTAPHIVATNGPKLDIVQHELGAGEPVTVTAHVGTWRRNVRQTIDLPRIARGVRNDGGYVNGSVSLPGPDRYAAANYAVSYAAFNVSASESGTQWLVWVTQWDGAAAIAAANVELIRVDDRADVHVVATAATDADGVAVLPIPDEPATDGPRGVYLLRATHQGRRAILPLQSNLSDVRDEDSHYARLHERGVHAWGVSDRALYRGGETVHYRIWLRERAANHLHATAPGVRKFALTSLFGDTHVTEFEAELDRFGSVSGAFHLPPTLRDDNYCIVPVGINGGDDTGTCFRVTGYHVNDMWAELHADGNFVHEGDVLSFDASAGYFSGGPAADVPTTLRGWLQSKRLGETYPEFARYTFAQVASGEPAGQGFEEAFPKLQRTDANGHVRARVTLVADDAKKEDVSNHIPFGTLYVDASAGLSGATAAMSVPLEITFSRHARYVGLEVEPWTLRDDADPEVSAVVITEHGARVPDATVHIEIQELERDLDGRPGEMKPGKVLAHCALPAGQKTACPFRAPRSGSYRFRASSDGAAEATEDRYAFVGGSTQANAPEAPHARLSVVAATVTADQTAQLVLQQSFAKAEVLFSIEHGRVLKHWRQHVDAPVTNIALPVPPEWAPGVTVHATVLDAASDPFGKKAQLTDIVQGTSVDIHITAPKRAAALSLELAQAEAHPGAEIAFTLRNQSPRELQLTLAVVDDAALALVPEFAAATDPSGDKWLGLLSTWDQTSWYSLGDLPRLAPEAHFIEIEPKRDYYAPGAVFAQRGQALDTIVVTGSNIRRVDIYTRAPATTHAFAFLPHGSNLAHGAMRARFSESALWDADSTLAAGAARTVRVRLPDNLTRWRILAWANDVDDTFALAQATVAASLPIEARAELPTRLFPGDVAQFGANVRNHGAAPRTLQMQLTASGAGVSASTAASAPLAPHAQQRLTLLAQPSTVGSIEVETRAGDAAAGDALASSVEVASPVMRQRIPVAGWLTPQGVSLPLPALPDNASHAQVRIEVARGLNAFAKTWIDALHEYPHRCWEQILSRAVGAAAAKQLDLGAAWPDADEVVNDALRVAGQYQDREGHFRFFPSTQGVDVSAQSPFLTAYTVRVFGFLQALGYRVPQVVEEKARKALAQAVEPRSYPRQQEVGVTEEFAMMAGLVAGDAKLDAKRLDAAWSERGKLSWSARTSLTRALTLRPEERARAQTALEELRNAGSLHGLQRVVSAPDTYWPFASVATDQCEVAAALAELDDSAATAHVRDEYLRGIADLYAGGGAVLGTQPSARCLMTLVRHAATPKSAHSLHVDVSGAAKGEFDVVPNAIGAWSGSYPASSEQLMLRSDADSDALLSYVANVEFDIDGRQAQPSAVGLTIERSYAVLRNKHWQPVPAAAVHEGDWVQVTLRVSTLSVRRFVAITDSVAGGLRPTDLELAGVADIELRRLATPISPYFAEHQIDDRYARFYAEQLSPGMHELHYYARAAHPGTYSTLPAVAELMYGSASAARTATGSVHIVK